MKKTLALLLTTLAATAAFADGTFPSSTDEARAQAAKRNATASHAASMRPFVSEIVFVTDTDSARRAAAQATSRNAHYAYLSEMFGERADSTPVTISVTDTDSARAAAAQRGRGQQARAQHAAYLQQLELSGASK